MRFVAKVWLGFITFIFVNDIIAHYVGYDVEKAITHLNALLFFALVTGLAVATVWRR